MLGPVMSASSRPTLAPVLRERDGEVDADTVRLADAALAGRDGDDVLHARDELLRLCRLRRGGPSRPR